MDRKNQYLENDHTAQSNLICKFSAIPIKLPLTCFTELGEKKKTLYSIKENPV